MALKVVIYVLAALAVVVLVLAFVPLPGYYNVRVSVTSWTVSALIVNEYGISAVNPSVDGQSTILDFGVLGGLSGPALQATYDMTVCVGSHCTSKSASVWFPTVPILNGGQLSVTNTFTIGYVPSGTYPVTATLQVGGSTVASGSSSICVGC